MPSLFGLTTMITDLSQSSVFFTTAPTVAPSNLRDLVELVEQVEILGVKVDVGALHQIGDRRWCEPAAARGRR